MKQMDTGFRLGGEWKKMEETKTRDNFSPLPHFGEERVVSVASQVSSTSKEEALCLSL